MNQVTVDVGVRLNVLQSSLAEFQRVLNKNLEPDSSGYKKLSQIIATMTKEMEKFEAQTSKSFSSNKQFTQTNSSIEKMEESLTRAELAVSKLKFSDIKLDANQIAAFKTLENDLAVAEQKLESLKEKTKQGIFADPSMYKNLENVAGKNVIGKSFDDIERIIEQKSKTVETTLANARERYKTIASEYSDVSSKNNMANDLLQNGFTGDMWSQFLNKAGTGFSSHGGRKAFLQFLQEQLEVDPAEVQKIAKLSLDKINEGLTTKDGSLKNIFQNLFGTFSTKEGNYKEIQDEINKQLELQNAIQALQDKMSAAKADGTPLSNGMIAYNAEIERVAAALDKLRTSSVRNVQTNSQLQGSMQAMGGQLNTFANQLEQARVGFLRLQQQAQTFNSLKMTILNFMGFYQVLNLVKRGIKDAANHIKELDSIMNSISVVTNQSTADLWKQVDAYSQIAQNYGVSIKGAYEVSKIYYQQGLETNDVLTLTNETLKLSKISGLDYAKSTDYMTTAIRGFKMEMSEASTVVDVYSNLAAHTAVSQEELAIAMSKTASSLESVGASFEESSAMIATMVAVTRESATNIGSALKSIASRYGELTKDPTKLLDSEGDAMSFNKVDAALQSVGISLQTADHQFRNFTDVIIELAEKWDTLDSVQQRYIATQFAGNRQQSRFLALVSNKDLLEENIKTAQDSEDVGDLQALKTLDSVESKLEQVRVAYQQFYTTIGAESVWKSALDGIQNFINSLNSLPKLFGKIPVNAILVILDIIKLVKEGALVALEAIATRMKTVWTDNSVTEQAGEQGKKAGTIWQREFITPFQAAIAQAKKDLEELGVTKPKTGGPPDAPIRTYEDVLREKEQQQQQPQVQQQPIDTGAQSANGSAAAEAYAASYEATLIHNIQSIGDKLAPIEMKVGSAEIDVANLQNVQAEINQIKNDLVEFSSTNPTIDMSSAQDQLNAVQERLTDIIANMGTLSAAGQLQINGILQTAYDPANLNVNKLSADSRDGVINTKTVEEATASVEHFKAMVESVKALNIGVDTSAAEAELERLTTRLTQIKEEFGLNGVTDNSAEKQEEVSDKQAEMSENKIPEKSKEAEQALEGTQQAAEKVKEEIVQTGEAADNAKGAIENMASSASSGNVKIVDKEKLESEIETVKGKLEELKGADVTPEQLKAGLDEAYAKIAEIEAELQQTTDTNLAEKLKEDLAQAKQDADELKTKLDGMSNTPNPAGLEQFQSKMYGLSTAINMIAMAINKSSSAGRIFSGVLMGIAGIIRIISAIGEENPFVAIASGILMVVNGLATAYETSQERLERLQKTAEDLSNKAKQVKQDYKTIKEAKQKYEDLQKTRYESEEAAEEYKTAVEELANQFPSLIESIDETGEITLNQSKLEETLADARKATAKATYEALQAEYEARKAEVETKKQDIIDAITLGETFETSSQMKQVRERQNSTGRSLQFNQNTWEANIFSEGYAPLYSLLYNLGLNNTQIGTWSDVKTFFETTDESIIQGMASKIEGAQALVDGIYTSLGQIDIDTRTNELRELGELVEYFTIDATNETDAAQLIKNAQRYKELATKYNITGIDWDVLDEMLPELPELESNAEGAGRATLSYWAKGLETYDRTWAVLEDNSKMLPLVTEALLADAKERTNGDLTEYKQNHQESAEQVLTALDETYATVVGAERELLDSMLENMGDYTMQDFIDAFGWEAGSPIYEALVGYYAQSNQRRQDLLINNAKKTWGIDKESELLPDLTDSFEVNYAEIISAEKAEFTDNEVAFLNSILAQYEKLNKSGLTDRADTYGAAALSLWQTLQQIGGETEAALFDFIKENGISTKEDVDAVLAEAKRLGVTGENYDQLEKNLSGVRDSIIENLNLAINANIEEFTSKWGDKSKTLKKMTSGMDFSEVQELIDMASTFDGFELGLSDFKSNGKGQLVLTAEKSEEFWKKYMESMRSQATTWEQELEAAEFVLEKNSSGGHKTWVINGVKNSAEQLAAFQTILGEEQYSLYFDEEGRFIGADEEAFWKAVEEAYKSAETGIKNYRTYLDLAEEQILTEQQWKAGNYSSLQLDEGVFDKYLTGKEKYDAKEDPAIATAVKQVQSGVSDLLSGLLTTGIEDFNITDYAESGIETHIFTRMQQDLQSVQNGLMSYQQFIINYAKYTGKTAAEMESLIAQAHAKDYEGNVYEGFSEIVGSYEKFSYEAGQKFAKSLGTSVEDLISKGIIDVDVVTGDLSIEYDKLKKYLAANMHNMSIKQYNELRAKLEAAENKQSDDTILGTIIQNRHKLSEENVASLATLLNMGYVAVTQYLTKNADGTYDLDLSTIETLIRTGQIKVTEEVIELIDNEIDTILSTLTGLGSIQGKGTTKIEDMRKRADAINQQLGTNYSLQDLFTYDTNLHAFVYSTEGLQIQARSLAEELENLKQNTEANADEIWAVQQSMKNIGIEMANNIDYSGFLSLSRNDPARQAKWQEVYQAIEDYNTVMAEMGQTMGLNADAIMASLTLGGDNAVVAIEAIAQAQGKTVSESDVEAAYRAQVGQYIDAIDSLTAKPGEIIDATTASLIKTSGGAVRELGNSGRYVVESAANLYEAYNQLLQMLKITGEATLAEINQVAALALENRDGEQSVIDALGDAAGMTYTRFGEILTEGGIELTEDLVNALETAGIIQSMGGNKMRITDFQAFADLMGWEPDSEEYVSAFRTYNDSMIELNRKTEQTILSEVKSLSGAKGGDWINLTQFSTIFDKMLPSDTEGSGLTSILDIVNSKISQYGGYIEDGILKLEAGANIPAIIQEITATAAESGGLLTSEMAELADTLNEVLQAYADLIRSGISGTLTNSQASELQNWGKSLGVDIDFTQTKEGLKISTDSAIALYKELQKIDSIQADLVFEDLVEALSGDKGGKLSNVSKTSAEIAKIQRQIYENGDKIAELREKDIEGNSEKVKALQAQNVKLKEQLSLYNQIVQRQSIDPNQYNFMDRDLPDTLQGPMNYWNSVGKAMEALNTASSSGKIGIQDFYNIVYEMENLANIAGTTFNWAGYTIGGEASQAAALIQEGMTALSNVDGKGVQIDLSKLGVQFVAGAKSAKNNIESGVEALADSQIAMIDAAIKVLEVVVAMEGLSDIDVDNEMGFSFGDMFNLDAPPGGFTENGEAWYKFTEEYVAWQKKMIEKLTEGSDTYDKELDEAMSNIQINGKSLKELLKMSADQVAELGIGQEGFFQVLKAFETAAASGDYNLDTIQDSVWEVLDAAGLTKDMTINVGDYTITVVGGTKALIDWSSPNTQQVLEDLQKHYGKDEEAARTYLTEAMVAFQQGKMTDPVQVLMVLHATGKIEIVYDDEGKPKIKVGDSEVDPSSHEGQNIIAREVLKAKGLNEEDIFGGGTKIVVDEKGKERRVDYISVKTSLGNEGINVEVDSDGNVIYKSTTYGVEASTLEELEDKIIDKVLEDPGNSGKTRYQARQIAFGMEVEPKVTINTKFDSAEKKKAGIEFSETASHELADLVRAGGGSFSGETFKYTPSEDGQTVTIDYKGVQVTVENTGDVEKNIEAAQTQVAELVDADGLIEKITTAITNAFSGEAGAAITRAIVNGLLVVFGNLNLDGTDFTIPEVPVNIGNLKVGQVNKTTIGEGDQFGDLFNRNNLTIDEVKAELKQLDISKIGKVDFSEAESVGEEIVDALQNFLDENPVKIFFDKGNEPDYKKPTPKEESPANTGNRTNNDHSETNTTYGSKQPRDSAQINHIEPKGLSPEIEAALTLDTNPASTALDGVMSQLTGALEGIDLSGLDTSKMQEAADAIANVSSDAATEIKNTLESIDNSAATNIKNILESIKAGPALAAAAVINNIKAPSNLKSDFKINVSSSAKGNVALVKGSALAGGQRTLMGELGPELVVSNGQYFLVGENGAEFVDLAKDAIVFNHLQTERLLKNGSIGGYGRPVTNENNAVSRAKGTAMAEGDTITKKLEGIFRPTLHRINWLKGSAVGTSEESVSLGDVKIDVPKPEAPTGSQDAKGSLAKGNISGPAMASASEALAVLKQLRAMWQSLKSASLKDLGGMPGGSGGGGGGGGGEKTANQIKSITKQVNQWYNWLKEIESLQQNINKLTKEYNLLEKQELSRSQKVANLNEQIDKRKQDINTRKQFIEQQKKYRASEIKRVNKGLMSAFYYADPETGRVYLANDENTNASFANFLETKAGQKANGKWASVMRSKGVIKGGQKINYQHEYTQEDADKAYEQWKKDQKKKGKKPKSSEKEKAKARFNKKVGTKVTRTLQTKYDIRTGADFMNELQRQKNGQNVHKADEQWAMIKAMGFDDILPDILAGIDQTKSGWEEQAVENFYAIIDADKEAVESLTKSIEEQEDALLDDELALQDINNTIREMYKITPGVVEGLEEWYNETKKIQAAQAKLNYLTKENDNLQNDFIANGQAIYENYQKQLKALEEEKALNEDLIEKREQKAKAYAENKLVQKFIDIDENGTATFSDKKFGSETGTPSSASYVSHGEILLNEQGYQYDENGRYVDDKGILRDKNGKKAKEGAKFGQVQYAEGKKTAYSAEGKTIQEVLADLTKQNENGETVYTADEQYQILKGLGLEEFMKYDASGKQIYDRFGELTPEEMTSAVEAGIKRIQETANEINENQDELNKLNEEQLSLQAEAYNIQRQTIDRISDLQTQVRDAIVQEHQDLIDEKNELADAISKAADKTISGLRESLEKEKQLYESDKDEKELTVLQMQLAAALSSSSSIAKIRDLQKQIQEKQKDMYFTEKENAIDELEDTANKQVELLQNQADMMATALQYWQDYGLIWGQVNEKLNSMTPAALADYIKKNSPDWLTQAPAMSADALKNTLESLQFFEAWKNEQKQLADKESTLSVDEALNNKAYKTWFTDEQKNTILTGAKKVFQETNGSAEDKLTAANAYIEQEVQKQANSMAANKAKTLVQQVTSNNSNIREGIDYGLNAKAKQLYLEGKSDSQIKQELTNLISNKNRSLDIDDILKSSELKDLLKSNAAIINNKDLRTVAENAYDQNNGDMAAVTQAIKDEIYLKRTTARTLAQESLDKYLGSKSSLQQKYDFLTDKGSIFGDYERVYAEKGEKAANELLESTIPEAYKKDAWNKLISKKKYAVLKNLSTKDLNTAKSKFFAELEKTNDIKQAAINAGLLSQANGLSFKELSAKTKKEGGFKEIYDKIEILSKDYGKKALQVYYKKQYVDNDETIKNILNNINGMNDSALKEKVLKPYYRDNELYTIQLPAGIKYYKKWKNGKPDGTAYKLQKAKKYTVKNNPRISADQTYLKIPKQDGLDTMYFKASDIVSGDKILKLADIKTSLKKAKKTFAQGGKIDFTGPAWVDGTKQKPEYILNNDQMNFLKAGLLDNVKLTSSLLTSLQESLNGSAQANTYTNITNDNNANVNIGQASVNINVAQVANDYDARRIGQQALNEMVRIARKAGNNSISRR